MKKFLKFIFSACCCSVLIINLTDREKILINPTATSKGTDFHYKVREIYDQHRAATSGKNKFQEFFHSSGNISYPSNVLTDIGGKDWKDCAIEARAAEKAKHQATLPPVERQLIRDLEQLSIGESFFKIAQSYAEKKKFLFLLDWMNTNATQLPNKPWNQNEWANLFFTLFKNLDTTKTDLEIQEDNILAIIKKILVIYPNILLDTWPKAHHLQKQLTQLTLKNVRSYLDKEIEKIKDQIKDSKTYTPENSSTFFDAQPIKKQITLSEIKQLAADLKISQLLDAIDNRANIPLLKDTKAAKEVWSALADTLEQKKYWHFARTRIGNMPSVKQTMRNLPSLERERRNSGTGDKS